MYKRTFGGFAVLTLFLAACIWLLEATWEQFPLGMDLRGGAELIYELELDYTSANPEDVAEEVKDIMGRRLNAFGLKELSIAVDANNHLVVQLPGSDEAAVQRIKQQIERAGNLRFQIVATGPSHQANMPRYETEEKEYLEKLAAYTKRLRAWERTREENPSYAEPAPRAPVPPKFVVRDQEIAPDYEGGEKTYSKIVLQNDAASQVSGEYIDNVGYSQDPDSMRPAVAFSMRGEGASLLGDLTGGNLKRNMAVVLDDIVVSAPTIQSRISTNGQITGSFTDQEVKDLITTLRGGSLRAKPRLLSESTVGSILGEESKQAGIRAVLIGLVLVFGFVAIYYLAAGLAANFALVFNIVVVLAYVTTFRQDLTLPGIAGILLTIGMAVDANILIFERVREERKRGKGLVQALTTGYQRAFSVIFDSNLTTVITGLVLFNFGTGPVKGFAVTLIAGIIVSFISALFVTRLLLSFALNKGLIKELKMMSAFDTPKITFTNIQRPFLTLSTVVIVLAWGLVLFRGSDNYGIDFNGGARLRVQFAQPIERVEFEKEIEALADERPELFQDWSLQTIGESVAVEGATTSAYREFALLTRAGGDGGLPTANAQAADPAPAPAPETSAPATAAGSSASESPSARDESTDAAQLVRAAIEDRLRDRLLPAAFPADDVVWRVEGEQGEALSVLVNLADAHEGLTADWIRENLQQSLDATDASGASTLRVAKAERVQPPTNPGVAQFRLEFEPYTVPTIAEVGGLPTKAQAFEAVRAFFREPPTMGDDASAPFALSEPFPQVSTVGPSVASDLQGKAIIALFISIVGIIFYVSLRFEFIFGLAAIAALVHDVLICIGFMAIMDLVSESVLGGAMPIKLNLPELAALLTTIGYSINDTIVVFDRIRENLRLHAKKRITFRECVNLSINQTLSRTIWTSLTTFLTVASLLILGGEAVRGFAFTFMIGLIAGTYSSIFVASPILIYLHDRQQARLEEAAKATA